MAKEALAQGSCVVVGLQSTGEAAAAALNLNPGDACGFVSTTQEIMLRFLEDHFPVRSHPGENAATGMDPAYPSVAQSLALSAAFGGAPSSPFDGKPAAAPPADPKSLPLDEQQVSVRDQLKERCRALGLPANPLDQLVDELGGPSAVAEMTARVGARCLACPPARPPADSADASAPARRGPQGRKARIVRNAQGRGVYTLRAANEGAEARLPLSRPPSPPLPHHPSPRAGTTRRPAPAATRPISLRPSIPPIPQMDNLNIREKDAFQDGPRPSAATQRGLPFSLLPPPPSLTARRPAPARRQEARRAHQRCSEHGDLPPRRQPRQEPAPPRPHHRRRAPRRGALSPVTAAALPALLAPTPAACFSPPPLTRTYHPNPTDRAPLVRGQGHPAAWPLPPLQPGLRAPLQIVRHRPRRRAALRRGRRPPPPVPRRAHPRGPPRRLGAGPEREQPRLAPGEEGAPPALRRAPRRRRVAAAAAWGGAGRRARGHGRPGAGRSFFTSARCCSRYYPSPRRARAPKSRLLSPAAAARPPVAACRGSRRPPTSTLRCPAPCTSSPRAPPGTPPSTTAPRSTPPPRAEAPPGAAAAGRGTRRT